MRKKVKVADFVDTKIPDSVKVLFGRFTVFSILMIFILAIVYPILLTYISLFSAIGILVVLFLFYLYMVYDVIKHKDKYSAILFPILMIATALSFGIAILKLIQ